MSIPQMITTAVRVVIIPSISPGDVVLTYRRRETDDEHASVTKRCLVDAINNRSGRDSCFFVRSDSGNSGVYFDARALVIEAHSSTAVDSSPPTTVEQPAS